MYFEITKPLSAAVCNQYGNVPEICLPFYCVVLCHATADNSLAQENCPFDSPGQNFIFLEAAGVVFAFAFCYTGFRANIDNPCVQTTIVIDEPK